ncbi:hypothetical protein MRA01_53920 [Methylobacterium radiotolerans]|nr:hypothetical protein MRA01_53920 [Methylobacterium radiotolerans]
MLKGRDGRQAERPVLRAITILYDGFWPEAERALRRRPTGKAEGLGPTQPSRPIGQGRIYKAVAGHLFDTSPA